MVVFFLSNTILHLYNRVVAIVAYSESDILLVTQVLEYYTATFVLLNMKNGRDFFYYTDKI